MWREDNFRRCFAYSLQAAATTSKFDKMIKNCNNLAMKILKVTGYMRRLSSANFERGDYGQE